MGGRGDSATNCYMGGRGEVQPTVTWEREVQCDQLLHGSERSGLTVTGVRRGEVRPTVTWEGEVKCNQLLHGRGEVKCDQLYMGGKGEVRPTVTWEGKV